MGTHSLSGSSSALGHKNGSEGDVPIDGGFLPVPSLVQWMATTSCPMSCPHCLAAPPDGPSPASRGKQEGSTALPLALSLVSQIAKMGVREFLITGGEPLVYKELPTVIDALRDHRQPWSINTAWFPSAAIQKAIERHPPVFAAVSLDGPETFHDSFRGVEGAYNKSLESVRYFSSLDGCRVAAGTTVTTRNLPFLKETFHIVAQSGAHSWGIHLPVPEGRASVRPDLFPSTKQLADLLRFVARARHWFPVSMADELGFCGEWEPLVRDIPMACGAGRAQCVILPGGDVVPCSTLDLSTSAGNLTATSLEEIWTHGFEELREWRPEGKCRSCSDVMACRGGCWLARREGGHCHKAAWETPVRLLRAASIAVAMGLATAPGLSCSSANSSAQAQFPVPPSQSVAEQNQDSPARGSRSERGASRGQTVQEDPAAKESDQFEPLLRGSPEDVGRLIEAKGAEKETTPGIEEWILRYYSGKLPQSNAFKGRGMEMVDFSEVAAIQNPTTEGLKLLDDFIGGRLGDTLADRADRIHRCLDRCERSMGLAALMWRILSEPLLKGGDAASRSPQERTALREAMISLGKKTLAWRFEILESRLDPYLARHRLPLTYRFEMSKAYIPPPNWLMLIRDTQEERWGRGDPMDTTHQAKRAWIEENRYAREMRLAITPLGETRPVMVDGETGKTRPLEGETGGFGIFDFLATGSEVQQQIEVSWPGSSEKWTVTLPADSELSWMDIVRLAWEQNQEAQTALLADLEYSDSANNALLLPLVMHAHSLGGESADKEVRQPSSCRCGPQRHYLDWWITDFWMF